MKVPKNSLRKIVRFLNNPDEDGGFWLPNIQRPFVWSEEQICRLFDSILCEYPIGTLLIWKTRGKIRRRKLIDNYRQEYRQRLSDFYVPEDDTKKCLVLDGQQRLQSLYIGLCGSYEGKELYLDILSGGASAPDDIKYKFDFLNSAEARFPYLKFKEIVFSNDDPVTAAETIIENAGRQLSTDERKKVSRHVGLVFKTFHSEEGIVYQEIDSTDNKDLYTEDDVVEVFIRANSGGTRLGKSDILFALLSSSWDYADKEMELLLEDLNQHGFAFTRDFVLKTCLTLLDHGARYEVLKFRKPGVREQKVALDDLSPRITQLRQRLQQLQSTRSELEGSLSDKRVELADMETVTGYVSDLRSLLEESPFPERRSFIKSFVKDVEVTGNQVLLTYTIPMQPHKMKGESIDVPLIGHYGGEGGTRTPMLFST